MTRFARAKGSKSSNERIPENSTSWGEMKQQLIQKKDDIIVAEQRNEANQKRLDNYQSFLNEADEEKSKDVKWAEFDPPPKQNQAHINDDDAPEETSSKVEPPAPQIVKHKIKKTPLKIVAEKESADKEPTDAKTAPQKRKSSSGDAQPKKKKAKKEPPPPPKPKKDPSEMDDKEKKKYEKAKLRKGRQLEKRKLKKAELKKLKEDPNYVEPVAHAPPKKRPSAAKPERRKEPRSSMIVNGREVEIAYIDGFPIKKEDAERIRLLKRQMIGKGLPRSEIGTSLKLERRKAEKAFARERKKVCFNCRQSGHNLSECPELGPKGDQLAPEHGTGICFKCGSTEHTHFECRVVKGQEFKFAQCFICNEQGHIARQCPDNAKGLYPKGGACKVCGDVTHMKKDCPKFQAQQAQLQDSFKLGTFNGANPDDLGGDEGQAKRVAVGNGTNKIVKF